MKKIFYLTLVSLMTSLAMFAQKSDIRSAEKMADEDQKTAREILAGLKGKIEPEYQAYAEYVAGLIEFETFKKEYEKMITPNGGAVDTMKMYNALLEEFPHFFEVERLEYKPDEDGDVDWDYTEDAMELIVENNHYQHLLNAGTFFINHNMQAKCVDAYELFLKVKAMKILAEEEEELVKPDDTSREVAYFAPLISYQIKDYDRAIRLATEYKAKQDYKKNDLMQILCASYMAKADTVSGLKVMLEGAELFPKSEYYLPNAINIYLIQGKLDQAKTMLTKALEKDPKSRIYLLMMANVYEQTDKWDEAGVWYKKLLEVNPKDFQANYNLARSYYNQAVELLNAKELDKLTENKAKEFFKQALPYFEAAYKIEPDKAYYLLSNVYDRLGMTDKYNEVMSNYQ